MGLFQPPTVNTVLGVGFGPANLALAVAFRELADGALARRSIFLEKQPRFGWHRGMLIDGATMQVSFLKDLATLRNPRSAYTFVSYLDACGRLSDFINSKTLYPFRTEFHDYLAWVAEQFAATVSYGTEVTEIRPVFDGGVVRSLDVVVAGADGRSALHRTENVVIGGGLVPRLPGPGAPSERIWHSSELLHRLDRLTGRAPRRFAVVGSGQSAAEVVDHLHSTYADAEVHAVLHRFGYSVADDSPFVNRIFDPGAVDRFFQAPDDVKQMLLDYHGNTNYGVVDLDLAQHLHDVAYRESLAGRRRLHVHNVARVRSVAESATGVDLEIEDLTGAGARPLAVDHLVYATGYRPFDPRDLLGPLAAECKTDDNGRLVAGRDYRLITSDAIQCGIYVHGAAAEHSHGLSAGLLSNVAVRAGEIGRSILERAGDNR